MTTEIKQKRTAALGIALVILALSAPLICVSVLVIPLIYDEDSSTTVIECPESHFLAADEANYFCFGRKATTLRSSVVRYAPSIKSMQ